MKFFDDTTFTAIWNFVNIYTLFFIIAWWFLRIIYTFLRKTTVAIFATKIDKPSDNDIKRWLWFLRNESWRIHLIENLDTQNNVEYIGRLKDFYYRFQSKISDLLEANHISLFLLAHQSLITRLWFDFQDQKSISIYHKIRDTYWVEWSWEKWYHFRLIRLLSGWKNHVFWWKTNIRRSSTLDFNKDLVLRLQISFPISSTLGGVDQNNFIEINLEKNGIIGNKSYLRYEYQIREFEKFFKNFWREIDSNFLISWKDIHIIMNVPAPFAFIIWKNIHSVWPTVHLYEETNGAYQKVFTLKKP